MDNLIDPKRSRAWRERMAHIRVRLVADRPREVVEVHQPTINAVDMASVTIEY